MAHVAHFRLWLDTKEPRKVERIIVRVRKVLLIDIPDYACIHGEQITVTFTLSLASNGWSDALLECLQRLQRLGYSWTLRGSIDDDPLFDAVKFSVSGVRGATVTVSRDRELS